MADSFISRRSFVAAAAAGLAIGFTGCSAQQTGQSSGSSASASTGAAAQSSAAASAASAATKTAQRSLVVFFSRAGENYEVGFVDEGNTAKVAHSIAGKIVSSVFEIIPATDYPSTYDECVKVAVDELKEKARPSLATTPENFDSYDTVYLGYPIWCEDLPMIIYSFAEGLSWSGKTVIPFCTYGSSGNSGTFEKLTQICKGATVKDGLEIAGTTAQNDSSAMDKAVNEWLAKVRS